jgi:hypothetical protein
MTPEQTASDDDEVNAFFSSDEQAALHYLSLALLSLSPLSLPLSFPPSRVLGLSAEGFLIV